MLSVAISGGLGNQMFQYAFAKYLSVLRQEEVFLNTYLLEKSIKDVTPRNFELGCFDLKFQYRSEEMLYGKNKILNLLIRHGVILGYGYEDHFGERTKKFLGHWHNLAYLRNRDDLRTLFELKSPSDSYLRAKAEVQSVECVAVHIRRGDYLTNPKATKHHGVTPLSYFMKALEFLKKQKPGIKVYLFSDDLTWAKENLEGTSIELNTNPAEEMMLMSHCSHNIISNSSFSWWSAYLNNNSQQIVIYPEKWFVSISAPQIFLPDWVAL